MPNTPGNRVLWARRVGGFNAWQFPQGGINAGETPEDAVFSELYEEIGVCGRCDCPGPNVSVAPLSPASAYAT